MTNTQIFEFDYLGQHASCGGNVFLFTFPNGGRRRCTLCGAQGVDAQLRSEIGDWDTFRSPTLSDLTVVTE